MESGVYSGPVAYILAFARPYRASALREKAFAPSLNPREHNAIGFWAYL